MKQHTFTLTDTAREYPARFGKFEVTYTCPETWEEVLAAADKMELPASCTKEQVLYYNLMHQSGHLNIQKAIKAELGREVTVGDVKRNVHADRPDSDIPQIIASAIAYGESKVLSIPGAPREAGAGTKVAKAEAKAAAAESQRDSAKAALASTYRLMPKNLRRQLRAQILESGALTEEDLAAIDAEG